MILNEAVEAAALALYESPTIVGATLTDVRRALEAAAPYMVDPLMRERDEARAAVDQLLEIMRDAL